MTPLVLVFVAVACISVSALQLDDQPPNGISKPSRWATTITPDPDYKPLL